MIYFRILLHAFFLLPATLLHEIAHAAIAAIFGKVASFSIIPQISQQTLVFGSVTSITRYRILQLFISMAPLIWWGVLYYFLQSDFFTTNSLAITANPIWVLAYAGKLSWQDIKVGLNALLLSRVKYIFALLLAVGLIGLTWIELYR